MRSAALVLTSPALLAALAAAFLSATSDHCLRCETDPRLSGLRGR